MSEWFSALLPASFSVTGGCVFASPLFDWEGERGWVTLSELDYQSSGVSVEYQWSISRVPVEFQ